MINSSKWFQGLSSNKLSMVYVRGLHNHRIKTMINDCASWLRLVSFREPSVYTRLIRTCLLCSELLKKLTEEIYLFKMEIFMDLYMFHTYYFYHWNLEKNQSFSIGTDLCWALYNFSCEDQRSWRSINIWSKTNIHIVTQCNGHRCHLYNHGRQFDTQAFEFFHNKLSMN